MLGARVVSVSLLILAGLLGQQTADQVFDQAVRLQEARKWAEAEQAYRAHLKRFGAKPETLANLGAVLVQQERFQEAIGAYTHALKLAPGVLPIRLNLGLAYFKSGQLAPAVEQFTAILEQQPANQQVRQLRAMCLLELERFEDAARDYSALLPSQDVNVSLGLASAYMRLDRTADALSIMEPLFERDSAEVKLLLGHALSESGRLEEAKTALERAAQLNPNLPMVRLYLGAVYWRQQETETAIVEWRKELSLQPESFQANYTLGAALAASEQTLETSKRIEEASRLLRKAVVLKPSSALALYQLGKLIWRQSKGPEAVSLLERSTRADPTYREAHYLLASIYQSLGRKEDAAREFAAVRQIQRSELRRSEDLFTPAR